MKFIFAMIESFTINLCIINFVHQKNQKISKISFINIFLSKRHCNLESQESLVQDFTRYSKSVKSIPRNLRYCNISLYTNQLGKQNNLCMPCKSNRPSLLLISKLLKSGTNIYHHLPQPLHRNSLRRTLAHPSLLLRLCKLADTLKILLENPVVHYSVKES